MHLKLEDDLGRVPVEINLKKKYARSPKAKDTVYPRWADVGTVLRKLMGSQKL